MRCLCCSHRKLLKVTCVLMQRSQWRTFIEFKFLRKNNDDILLNINPIKYYCEMAFIVLNWWSLTGAYEEGGPGPPVPPRGGIPVKNICFAAFKSIVIYLNVCLGSPVYPVRLQTVMKRIYARMPWFVILRMYGMWTEKRWSQRVAHLPTLMYERAWSIFK